MATDDAAPRIPLLRRDGSVAAYALVDAADAEWAGQWSWHLQRVGYAARGVHKTGTLYLHRELLGLEAGDSRQVDHINRDRLDNRRANLRVITLAQQRQNQTKKKGCTSRYRGVRLNHRGKWQARVQLDGHTHYLGCYLDEDEAGRVAADFRRQHMPYATD